MKKAVAIIVVVAVLAGLGYAGYKRFGPQPAVASSLRTSTAVTGTLDITVSGAANVEASDSRAVAFEAGGKVTQVHVKAGDRVEAGQLLAEIDTSDLELAVAKAQLTLHSSEIALAKLKEPASEAAIATAQANLETARESLAELEAGTAASELAEAQATLASAQETLDELKAGPAAETIATAEAAVKTAEQALAELKAKPDAATIQAAKAKLDQAKNSLWSSQSSRDSTCGGVAEGRSSSSACNSANAGVANQEINVQLAEADYQEALLPATAVELASADAQLKSARASLEKAKTGASAAELAAAEAKVQAAQENLTKVQQGASAAKLAMARAEVAKAEESLSELLAGASEDDLTEAQDQMEQNRLSLEKAQRELEYAKLRAPIAGTVTAVSIKQGNNVSAGATAVTIVDLAKLQLTVPLAETDVVSVAVGQLAEVTIDALSALTLQGEVTYIAPVATISQGVANFPVTIQLAHPDPTVRVGMTAAVNIILERHEGVLMVPNRAIKTVDRQKVIDVVNGDTVIQVPVQTGTTNGSYTEITAGALKTGDTVALNVSSGNTSATTGASTQIGGMGGGFMIREGGIPGGPGF